MRRLAIERRVGATLIVPVCKTRELLVERARAKWEQYDVRTAVLERQDESFNDRDTAVLANSAEAGCDPVGIAPILEHAAPELLALQGKGVTCVWRIVIHPATGSWYSPRQ